MGPWFGEACTLLVEPFRCRGAARTRLRTLTALLLDFHAWRTLRSGVPSSGEAVEAAVRAIDCQAGAR
jgi:hypothetical protein